MSASDRLFPLERDEPPGLTYRADFVSVDEEARLLSWVAGVELAPYVMHDTPSKRAVKHFGWDYDNKGLVLSKNPLPSQLIGLRDRAALLADDDPQHYVEALLTHYPAGAGIGWHRDAPQFGSKVLGISLLSACPMRFRKMGQSAKEAIAVMLEQRSAYVIAGAARWQWQHAIMAAPAERWSITFRTLRQTD